MNYIVDHIPHRTPHNRRPGHSMKPTTITIHNTGNPNSTARNERDWLTNPSNDRTASFHIVVDEREAIECIPFDEIAWAAGDGANGPGNRTSIHIELCESGNFTRTLENAVQLVVKLLQERGWSAERLRRHWDWPRPSDGHRKICPRLMYDDGRWTTWSQFVNTVENQLKSQKGDVHMQELIVNLEKRIAELEAQRSIPIPDWAQEAVNSAAAAKGIDGKPIVDTPEGGSLDFYRIITVMYRAGLFNRQER